MKCVFYLEVVKSISLIGNPLASRGGVLFERAKRSEFSAGVRHWITSIFELRTLAETLTLFDIKPNVTLVYLFSVNAMDLNP